MAEQTKTVEIVVEAKSYAGKGIKGPGDVWYNASKGVSFEPIHRKDKVLLTYVENGQGGKFVTSFTKTEIAALPSEAAPSPARVNVRCSPLSLPLSVVLPNPKASETMSKAEWDMKDLKKTKGGVSHDAAMIVAAMSAMKTDDEVKALFTNLYHHILTTVTA